MAVTVSASDIFGTALQTSVTEWQALVNAPTVNPAQAFANLQGLDSAQRLLVGYLMANAQRRLPAGPNPGVGATSFLTASGILSAGTINT